MINRNISVSGQTSYYTDGTDEGSCICGLNKTILDQLEKIVLAAIGQQQTQKEPEKGKFDQPSFTSNNPKPEETYNDEQHKEETKGEPNEVNPIENGSNGKRKPNKIPPSEESTSHQIMPTGSSGKLDSEHPSKNDGQHEQPSNAGKEEDKEFKEDEDHETEGEEEKEKQEKDKDKEGSSKGNDKGEGKGDDKEKKDDEEKKSDDSEPWKIIDRLTNEIHHLESLIGSKPGILETSNPSEVSKTSENSKAPEVDRPSEDNKQPSEPNKPPAKVEGNQDDSNRVPSPVVNNGFLGGVEPVNGNVGSNGEGAKVDPAQMTNAIESTVPNVVSNIFSSIQNLTQQTIQNPNQHGSPDSPMVLTSIDGNSVNLQHGGSTDEIMSEGEKLFLAWIEQQLSTLHLTASMAKYIRSSAVSLFRKIVKQYVDRVVKLGGSIEYNAKRATQMALYNTQNLITFLMKHYLYLSAGIMQIIGEELSRIGKQLDQTGNTIAHLNLNPLDIILKVMDNLPNPNDYSKYFREIGKNLIGDMPWNQQTTTTPAPQVTGANQQISSTDQSQQTYQSGGLFRKTMGALGKTLQAWIGK